MTNLKLLKQHFNENSKEDPLGKIGLNIIIYVLKSTQRQSFKNKHIWLNKKIYCIVKFDLLYG